MTDQNEIDTADDSYGLTRDRCPDSSRDSAHDCCHDSLRRQVTAAIDEIAAIRCPDPAAVDAFLTARLALHTLREMWLPNL